MTFRQPFSTSHLVRESCRATLKESERTSAKVMSRRLLSFSSTQPHRILRFLSSDRLRQSINRSTMSRPPPAPISPFPSLSLPLSMPGILLPGQQQQAQGAQSVITSASNHALPTHLEITRCVTFQLAALKRSGRRGVAD